jgi:hypothetical protein
MNQLVKASPQQDMDTGSSKDKNDIFNNVRYVCQSCTLITESLKKGCDVLQMSNGDVVITEVKVFTYHYAWDDAKGKFIRAKSDRRTKKRLRDSKYEIEEFEDEHDEFHELEMAE